jgi:RNA polymerase sigma-70 factor, ECF subfamily
MPPEPMNAELTVRPQTMPPRLPAPGRPPAGTGVVLLWCPPSPPPSVARRMSPAASQPDRLPSGTAGPGADMHAARAERDVQLAALVRASADGDCSAFESFYDRTIGYAETVARRLLRAADVEDLLADAYFEAWRGAARFDAGRGSAVTWLLTIVRSRALDWLRRVAARPEGALSDVAPADIACEGADPIDLLWQRQTNARLHAALATLDPRERWTLGLAYFRDCSHSEIAGLTGLPLGTVKSVLARAQSKLRSTLSDAP